ncbi:MAG: beta-carotene 15,15'-monooxygenase [Eubacterium sp.]|nr:beta-carotene 15,15'-monooxygenase [Eubacterium sp.]
MDRKQKIIAACVLAALAFISFLVIGSIVKNPETFGGIIKSLDEKAENVMALTGAAAASAAAITLIPGDVGTPIAEKLVDMSGYFMIILAAIYLEKWLVTITGVIAFAVLIPISLIGLALDLFTAEHPFRSLFVKVICFALILFAAVPASVMLAEKVDKTYGVTVKETIEEAEKKSKEIQNQAGNETNNNALEKIFNTVKGGVNGKVEEFKTILSKFIQAAAVLIVTSCVIPIAVMVFFIWIIKMIIGIQITIPTIHLSDHMKNPMKEPMKEPVKEAQN